jgi:hypothetical protein
VWENWQLISRGEWATIGVMAGDSEHEQLAQRARARREHAAQRAEQAHRRAVELRKYLEALEHGEDPIPPVDEHSIARAQAWAAESARRSADAHLAAAKSHELAAEMHERAAHRDPAQAAIHQRAAQRHREGAAADRQLSLQEPA